MRIYRLVRSISWKHAVGEVSLIVIGILVALFIDDWATDRANRKLEEQYLQALLDEVAVSIDNLQGNLRVNEISHDSLQRAQQLITAGDTDADPEQIVHFLLQGANGGVSPRFNTAVFDDLTSTGRLVLISDESVRRTIIDTYALMQIAVQRAHNQWDEFDLNLDAILVRYVPFGYFQFGGGSVRIAEIDIPEEVLKVSLDRILQDPRFSIEVSAELNAQIRAISHLKRLENQLEEYQDYLADVIGSEM